MGIKRNNNVNNELVVRINCKIGGLPALWLLSWKDKGLVRSNTDAIRQAFRCFEEELRAKNHAHELRNGDDD